MKIHSDGVEIWLFVWFDIFSLSQKWDNIASNEYSYTYLDIHIQIDRTFVWVKW